jgi:hypothetical protein
VMWLHLSSGRYERCSLHRARHCLWAAIRKGDIPYAVRYRCCLQLLPTKGFQSIANDGRKKHVESEGFWRWCTALRITGFVHRPEL